MTNCIISTPLRGLASNLAFANRIDPLVRHHPENNTPLSRALHASNSDHQSSALTRISEVEQTFDLLQHSLTDPSENQARLHDSSPKIGDNYVTVTVTTATYERILAGNSKATISEVLNRRLPINLDQTKPPHLKLSQISWIMLRENMLYLVSGSNYLRIPLLQSERNLMSFILRSRLRRAPNTTKLEARKALGWSAQNFSNHFRSLIKKLSMYFDALDEIIVNPTTASRTFGLSSLFDESKIIVED